MRLWSAVVVPCPHLKTLSYVTHALAGELLVLLEIIYALIEPKRSELKTNWRKWAEDKGGQNDVSPL